MVWVIRISFAHICVLILLLTLFATIPLKSCAMQTNLWFSNSCFLNAIAIYILWIENLNLILTHLFDKRNYYYLCWCKHVHSCTHFIFFLNLLLSWFAMHFSFAWTLISIPMRKIAHVACRHLTFTVRVLIRGKQTISYCTNILSLELETLLVWNVIDEINVIFWGETYTIDRITTQLNEYFRFNSVWI